MPPVHLPTDFDTIVRRQKSVFAEIAKGKGDRIVIMGTGDLGRIMAERLQCFPVTIECFCDNNTKKHGTTLLGRPVLAVEEAVKRFNGHAVFVTAIFNSSACQRQLKELGCNLIATAAACIRHFGPPLLPFQTFDLPTVIDRERKEVLRCAELWEDEKSRVEYQRLLDWFVATDQSTLVEHDSMSDLYYPPDVWTPKASEHLVDCGAYDGESLLFLAGKTGGTFSAATAFEPHPESFKLLQARMARQPADFQRKVRLVNAAVGSKPDVLHFSEAGSVSSAVESGGGLAVQCVTLDDEFAGAPPSYVKMDLEGYELEALTGMAKLMAKAPPILAITMYHKIEHLWQIPLLIHRYQPGYRLYLRRYAEDSWESVCYAVPPGRQMS
jgi:FkbM family methyltransferase